MQTIKLKTTKAVFHKVLPSHRCPLQEPQPARRSALHPLSSRSLEQGGLEGLGGFLRKEEKSLIIIKLKLLFTASHSHAGCQAHVNTAQTQTTHSAAFTPCLLRYLLLLFLLHAALPLLPLFTSLPLKEETQETMIKI